MRLLVSCNAYAAVGYRYEYRLPLLPATNGDVSFIFGVFHRIVYQVAGDVTQMRAVCRHGECVGFAFQQDGDGFVRFQFVLVYQWCDTAP
jgi:hypothetical protein